MIPTKGLISNLEGLGFKQTKKNLFAKKLSEYITIYRDYRKVKPQTYAYFKTKKMDHSKFKETQVIRKLEKELSKDPEKLTGYN